MMLDMPTANLLKNVVRFTGLSVGVPVSLPHSLAINSVPMEPYLVLPTQGGVTITADATNITATQEADGPDAVDVYVEVWHTLERLLPPSQLAGLVPFVMQPGAGGGGGGGSTINQVSAYFQDFLTNQIWPDAGNAKWWHGANGATYRKTADNNSSGINIDNDVSSYPERNVAGLLTLGVGDGLGVGGNDIAYDLEDPYPYKLGFAQIELVHRMGMSDPSSGGSTDFDIFWGLGVSGNPGIILDKGLYWAVSLDTLGNNHVFAVVDGGAGAGPLCVDTGYIADGTLATYKIVAFDGSGNASFYINDTLVATIPTVTVGGLSVKLGGKLDCTTSPTAGVFIQRFDYVKLDCTFNTPR